MINNYEIDVKVFKAFCDETRLNILDILKAGEQCGCMLLDKLNISQSTLSHHMRILCDSGIVVARKEGKWSHYSIDEEAVNRAKKLVDKYTKF